MYHPQETVKVFPVLFPWESRKELDSAVEKKNSSQILLVPQFCNLQANSQFSKLCKSFSVSLFVYWTGALPQDPPLRGGTSLARVVSHNGQHPVVRWSPKQIQMLIAKTCKIKLQFTILKLFRNFTLISLTYCTFAYNITTRMIAHHWQWGNSAISHKFRKHARSCLMFAIIQHFCNHYNFVKITLLQ